MGGFYLDIGMTIQCDDEGKFQIIHWPPLPVEDSVTILQILDVRNFVVLRRPFALVHDPFRNQLSPWKKFSIERSMLDASVGLRFVCRRRRMTTMDLLFSPQELKDKILSVTSGHGLSFCSLASLIIPVSFLAVIDPHIPALRCELLPESTSEEILFISINPFSGLYKVSSYMGNKP